MTEELKPVRWIASALIAMAKKIVKDVTEGSGNVFADLGLSDADELFAKSGLVHRIAEIIKKRQLTQMRAGAILSIDQPKISRLLRSHLDGFSTERLFRFLNALDQDIEIVIRDKAPRTKRHGIVSVVAATA